MILHNPWAELAIIVAAAGIAVALVLWYLAVIRPDRQAKRDATWPPEHTQLIGRIGEGPGDRDDPPDELVDAFADLRDSVMAADHPDFPIVGGELGSPGRHRYRATARGQRRPIGYGGRR